MASFNKVILLGHVTRNPENRGRDNTVCAFGLALNRTWKSADGEKQEEVCFVDCTAFGGRDGRNGPGDIILKYVNKGDPLLVEGRLKQDTWEDKETRQKRSKLCVIVEAVQLMGTKKEDGERRDEPSREAKEPANKGPENDYGFEDIPF